MFFFPPSYLITTTITHLKHVWWVGLETCLTVSSSDKFFFFFFFFFLFYITNDFSSIYRHHLNIQWQLNKGSRCGKLVNYHHHHHPSKTQPISTRAWDMSNVSWAQVSLFLFVSFLSYITNNFIFTYRHHLNTQQQLNKGSRHISALGKVFTFFTFTDPLFYY